MFYYVTLTLKSESKISHQLKLFTGSYVEKEIKRSLTEGSNCIVTIVCNILRKIY